MPRRTPKKQIHPVSGPERAFGLALREARKAAGLSQERMALECGLDRTYVSLIERGVKSPTLRTLFIVANAVATLPSDLIRSVEAAVAKEKDSRQK